MSEPSTTTTRPIPDLMGDFQALIVRSQSQPASAHKSYFQTIWRTAMNVLEKQAEQGVTEVDIGNSYAAGKNIILRYGDAEDQKVLNPDNLSL